MHQHHRAGGRGLAPHRSPLRGQDFTWSDFDAGLLDKVRPAFPDLPPAALALRIWSHLHGLISLEIYSHLRPQTLNPDKLFTEERAQLIQTLEIPPQQ